MSSQAQRGISVHRAAEILRWRSGSGIELDSIAPADLDLAQAAWRSDRLPRLEAIVLAAATADALRAVKRAKDAQALETKIASNLAARVTTLATWPERRARFVVGFPPR